jgi:hypothetical protein
VSAVATFSFPVGLKLLSNGDKEGTAVGRTHGESFRILNVEFVLDWLSS